MSFAAQPIFIQADAAHLPFDDLSVDLTFFSPPYCDARTYGIGAQRDCVEWVTWMLGVLSECQRVTKGPIVVVAAGVTRDRNYWPACEGLMWEWWKLGGDCHLYRPCFWHRVGIPGSGGDDWFRADVEYVMCFKRPGALPWSDNTAMGHPPKWGPGGDMSHRISSGSRVNQWGKVGSHKAMGAKRSDGSIGSRQRPSHRFQDGGNGGYHADGSEKPRYSNDNGFKKRHTKSRADCSDEVQEYEPPTLANPGNLVSVKVGGGVMGHKMAHENEAPFPEGIAEHFILSLCPPGGKVLDVCSGSGTTAIVAAKNNRVGIGTDIRFIQCELGARRAKQTTELHQGKLFGVPA